MLVTLACWWLRSCFDIIDSRLLLNSPSSDVSQIGSIIRKRGRGRVCSLLSEFWACFQAKFIMKRFRISSLEFKLLARFESNFKYFPRNLFQGYILTHRANPVNKRPLCIKAQQPSAQLVDLFELNSIPWAYKCIYRVVELRWLSSWPLPVDRNHDITRYYRSTRWWYDHSTGYRKCIHAPPRSSMGFLLLAKPNLGNIWYINLIFDEID